MCLQNIYFVAICRCVQAAKLYEYTEFGSIVTQVCLASELSNPRHAVLLDSGQFVVSLKDSICLVGADGRRILANKTSTPTGTLYPTVARHACSPQTEENKRSAGLA